MVLGLLAATVGVSALVLWVVLPQGYFASRLIWLEIHKWSGLLLSVGVLVHVVLHWRWLLRMTHRLVTCCRGRVHPAPAVDHEGRGI